MAWLDAAFPVTASGPRVRKHRLTNLGMGGTGSCAYARRLDALLDARLIGRVDLVLAEFAINDAELHGNAPPPPFGDHYHGPRGTPRLTRP